MKRSSLWYLPGLTLYLSLFSLPYFLFYFLSLSLYFCSLLFSLYYSLFSGLLATAFISLQIKEFRVMGLSINDSVYSSVFFFITGLHFFHLVFGIMLLCVIFNVSSLTHRITKHNELRASDIHLFYNLQVLYWHFLELLWLFIYLILYLSYTAIFLGSFSFFRSHIFYHPEGDNLEFNERFYLFLFVVVRLVSF